MEAIVLNGSNLTLEALNQIAYENRRVEIAPEAYERIAKSRQVMEELANGGKAIYGFNRGVGWNKDRGFESNFIEEYNKKLIRSHALGVPPFNTEVQVRAMMAIRLNAALIGASCVTDRLVEMYRDFLNAGIHPQIPMRGSVGEADITTISHFGLAFIGETDVTYQGQVMNSKKAMELAGLEPMTLELKDAHSIILSNSQGEAVSAVAVRELEDLLKMANVIYCLDYEGLNGNIESLDERVNAIHPIDGPVKCAAECRKYLEGSYLYKPHPGRALQDALTFRGGFSINGTVMDALEFVKKYLRIQINAPADNPCILPESGESLVSSNFEATTLAVGMEMVALALSHMSKATAYRMIKMTDPTFTGLTRFLAPWDDSSLGYATIQNTYTSLDVENRMLANPSSMDFYPMEGMIEDHGCNLPMVANKVTQMIDNLRYLVGMEAMYAAQAIDLREELTLGKYTRVAYDAIREVIPFLKEDRNMHADIVKMHDFIASKELLKRMEALEA